MQDKYWTHEAIQLLRLMWWSHAVRSEELQYLLELLPENGKRWNCVTGA